MATSSQDEFVQESVSLAQLPSGSQGDLSPRQAWLEDAARKKKKWYTLSRLRNSMIVGFLAVYHIYWLFAAMIIGFALGINILLSWYIEWFQYTIGNRIEDLPLGTYTAVLLRSCLLISLLSHLTRVAIWLMQDALRLEAFQVYRCMLCFGAAKEFSKGSPDAIRALGSERGWRYIDKCTGCWDVLMQVVIYFTFDILPLLMAGLDLMSESASGAISTWCIWACGAAVGHVLVFAVFELLNDICSKIISWNTLLLKSRARSLRRSPPSLRSASSGQLVDGVDAASPSNASRSKSVGSVATEGSHQEDDEEASDDAPWNACVLLCSFLQALGVVVLATILLAAWCIGIYRLLVENTYDVLVPTSLLLTSWILYQFRHLPRRCARKVAKHAPKQAPQQWSPSWRDFWKWAAETQRWAEVHCGLADHYAAPQYEINGIVTCLQAVLFWYIGWRPGMWLMLVILVLQVVRRLTLGVIKPFGWMVGLAENLGIVLTAIILNGVVTNAWYALGAFILGLAVQFKCSREHRKSWRFLIWVTFALQLLVLMIIMISMQTLVQGQGTAKKEWSNFCDLYEPGCRYFNTAEAPPRRGNDGYEFCDIHFPMEPDSIRDSDALRQSRGGGSHRKSLRLPQFAMLSALAYDGNATFNSSLQRWFNGWRIEHVRRVDEVSRDDIPNLHNDWTTFFELVEPETNVTVFVIRGTQKPLEILQDLNVWAPIAIPQVASFIGPDLTNVAAHAVLLLSTAMYGNWMQKKYYADLLEHVVKRKKDFPNRQYYLTGHSLGGGLAKLVSIETQVPAITFSSPGVSATRMLVAKSQDDGADFLHRASYTVIPDNDVVPRVDQQLGVQIPISCRDTPWGCHSSGETLCDLVHSCGSSLDHPVEVSCQLCPNHAHLFQSCRNVKMEQRESSSASKQNTPDLFQI